MKFDIQFVKDDKDQKLFDWFCNIFSRNGVYLIPLFGHPLPAWKRLIDFGLIEEFPLPKSKEASKYAAAILLTERGEKVQQQLKLLNRL